MTARAQHEGLEEVPVYQHLKWQWSFYGLTLLHVAAAGVLSLLAFLGAVIVGYSMMWGVGTFVGLSAGIAVLQWRQGPSYLGDLSLYLITPRGLTCLEDDDVTHPFPVAREALRRSLRD